MTVIKNKTRYDTGGYREIFDVEKNDALLKVYVKSNLVVYDVPIVNEVVVEKEEFCAAKLTFTVMKDGVMSFNQGDAVSVKYNSEGIFYGYVFSKSRDKKGLIKVICYDQMRYMKNRRTYTRGSMRLDEVVEKIASDCSLRVGSVDKCSVTLPAVAADNVSLLDVVKKACNDTRKLSGKRYILYDDCGALNLKNEENLYVDVVIDPSQAENCVYSDTIDKNVYNMVQIYSDTKKANLREITTVSDKENMELWGTLILSKKATDPTQAYEEGKNLLNEYNRINREIVFKTVKGDLRFIPGCSVYVKMTTGDLYFDGYVRVRKAVHRFKNNFYTTDVYLDGSEVE